MRNFIILIIIIAFPLSFISCKKHTSFYGKITSSSDNLPIKDAEVTLTLLKGKKGGGVDVISKEIQKTDSMGNYMVEIENSRGEFGELYSKKAGYVPVKPKLIQPGDCDEVDFIFNPYDAWLSVTFENTSITNDKQYFYDYTGAFLYGEIYKISGIGPFELHPNESRTEIEKIPGGADIYINWDTIHTVYTPLRNKLTVFCNRNDTTYVLIKI